MIDSTSSDFPSGLLQGSMTNSVKSLTIGIIFKIKDLCDSASNLAPLSLLTLTGQPPGGLPITYLDFYLDNEVFKLGTSGQSGLLYSIVSPLLLDSQYEFIGSIDLMAGFISSQIVTPSGLGTTLVSGTSGAYPADASFDSTTTIYLCADHSNLIGFGCEIQSMKFWYTFSPPQESMLYLNGFYPVNLLAEYQMINQGEGIIKSQGSLGSISITLGTPGPIWNSQERLGYDFSGSNGIEIRDFLPPEIVAPSYYKSSLTVSFWIKITEAPTTDNILFQYCNQAETSIRFALQLASDLTIKVVISNQSLLPSIEKMTLGVWRFVTANSLARMFTSELFHIL